MNILNLIFLALQSANPIFDWGACPFECCKYGEWITETKVALYEKMDLHSKQISIDSGTKIKAITGVVKTIEPQFIVSKTTLDSILMSFDNKTFVSIKAGDTVRIIRYFGEGQYVSDFKNHKFLIQYDENDTTHWKPINPLVTEWWVKINYNQSQFWILDPKRFSGMDACVSPPALYHPVCPTFFSPVRGVGVVVVS
jgi:hypothetical protein